ncbi:uncharacterized protein LOC123469932 [Daphnia magna]|uniref:uncharacterized protein LOC123469932 n=1 Tax=Daphnia magna TaxID=35525 RepID=UPI001E1BA605|nr:uncharacterized protein LOC123469932 [Daphnia magna]
MLKFKEDERPTLQKVLDSSYYNPSEDYKLYEDYKSPGLCVIFNQQVFRLEKKNREGSDKDRDALSDTFKKLGFNTEVHENLESFDYNCTSCFLDQSTNKEIDPNNQKEKLKEVLEILEDAPRNPPLMDFITIKSTLPGFVSYRLVVKDKNGQVQEYLGSSFIQALCETLSE